MEFTTKRKKINKKKNDKFIIFYNIYTYYKFGIAISSGILFILFCIIVNSFGEHNNVLCNILYNFCIAMQNLSITIFSIFILDYLINSSYKEQLNDDVAKILTNPLLLKNFIKEEKKSDILHCSLESIVGSKVSKTVERTILYNYQFYINNCYKKNMYIHTTLFEDRNNPEFYKASVIVNFKLIGLNSQTERNFEISFFEGRTIFDNYVTSLSSLKRILCYPFLSANNIAKIQGDKYNINYFKVNNEYIENRIEHFQNKEKIFTYEIPMTDNTKDDIYIEFSYDTYLNKKENYIFEDIICLYEGFHMSLNYTNTDIQNCNCYSSYKEKSLNIIKDLNTINVHVDGLVLPENLFIIIWNDKDDIVNETLQE